MNDLLPDDAARARINELSHEEEQLYATAATDGLTDDQRERLAAIRREREQQTDLLNQLQALSDAGLPPSQAELRSPEVIEGYEQ